MDYEKYNEALKRAKAAIDIAADKDLVKGIATTIFPELAESEDEKIRKWLITHLENNYKGNYWATQAISWLEKQKEQFKEEKVPEQCLKCNEYEIGYKAGYTHGCTAGYNKAMKEVEQKEQKPAWCEEDEEMIGCIIDDIREAKRNSDKEYFKELCDKEISWLKSLRPSWKPSEEMKQNYIRRDALLEWIQEARAVPHENAIVRDLAFQEVVNKINSM